ncbi:hypothetical protein LOTGIDRAFT_159641 [Lottia gigantea]|uniref:Scavenger receptor class B member 1 n=1 Tax=Lottia gigantea TaxID=225164 RepID=V3ZZD4_LOTGI|nr:hypothetical protein LOTGIDRAFT_159641 [Lottia gigantea]ESO96893.1 hypothetical protein LOTGIDRAFT_159641 [Lottia gigantea]
MISREKKVCIGAVAGLVTAIIGVVLIPVVDYIVKEQVKEKVTLVNGSYLYDVWKEPPMPIYLQVYMFNLTNPKEVKKGQKPYVVEKGPYTYREERIKFDIVFNDNGTVSYRQKRLFTFIREMSVGDDEVDMITTVNPALLALIEGIGIFGEFVKKIIVNIVGAQEDIFITRTIKELVWGYVDPSLKLAHSLLPFLIYTDFIGYFMNKNNTDDGVYTVYTGKHNIDLLGTIDRYNGSKYLNFWSTPWANLINGSDGTINKPFLEDQKYLYFFSSDICRAAYGEYTSNTKTKHGIKLHRYTGTATELANKTINPDNAGFCTKRSGCLGTGLLDLSICTNVDHFPIPTVMSFPHFYMADEKFIQGVYGMSPSKDKHETTVDVDPITGLLLQASKKLQINMHIVNNTDVLVSKGIKEVFLPVLWLDENMVIDDKNADKINNMLFLPMYIAQVVEITLIAGGSLIFLFSLFLAQRFHYLKKKAVSQSQDRKPLLNKDLVHDSYSNSCLST